MDLASVGVHDGVSCVLPPHVLVSQRGPGLVLLEAVAVEVAVAVYPLQAAEGDVAVLTEQAVVPEPAPGLVEGDQVQGGRVVGAVVRGVRDLPEVGQLAEADLVGDLAGLGVAPVVHFGGLQLGQLLEGAKGEGAVEERALQAHDQAVAPEYGDEPGHARRREPHVGLEVVVVEAQRPQVLHRLVVEAVDVLVGRAQRCDLPEPPVLQGLGLRRAQAPLQMAPWRPGHLDVGQDVVAARVPDLARLDAHVEGDAPVGVVGSGTVVGEAVDEPAGEVVVDVAGLELALLRPPLGHDPSPPHEAVLLHLEEVGEVRPHDDLEVQPHRLL